MNSLDIKNMINHFELVSHRYKGLLCDIWGVVHNGAAPHHAACEALQNFRKKDGKILLLSNSPRPSHGVKQQLTALGVPEEIYDDVLTSGDVTKAYIQKHYAGQCYHHIGPERDADFFDGLDLARAKKDETANIIICTGLNDDSTETPDHYRNQLADIVRQDIPMVCANPDLVVEKGGRLIYCAGALAELYQELGGTAMSFGKPHQKIYDAAFQSSVFEDIEKVNILAVGDAVRTDLKGAEQAGIDVFFIAGGIHAHDVKMMDGSQEESHQKNAQDQIELSGFDPQKIKDLFIQNQVNPIGWQPQLSW